MKDKKRINYFKIIFISFFIIYLCLYTINVNGYYEKRRGKVEFTKEQIERFEKDVEAGKNVDVESYLIDQNKDYSNGMSDIGYTVSTLINGILNKGINGISHFIGSLFS